MYHSARALIPEITRSSARISANVLLYHIGLTLISSLSGVRFQMPTLFAAFRMNVYRPLERLV